MFEERRIFSSDQTDISESMIQEPQMDTRVQERLGLETSLHMLHKGSPLQHFQESSHVMAGTPAPLLNRSIKSRLQDQTPSSPLNPRKSMSESLSTPYRSSHNLLQTTLSNSRTESTSDMANKSVVLEKNPSIEGSGHLFTDFLQLYAKHPYSGDVFDLVSQYEQICRQNIKSLLSHMNEIDPTRRRLKKTASHLQQLYEECYTWRLISTLFHDRIAIEGESQEADFDMVTLESSHSERDIIGRLFEREAPTRQSQLIVDWLEKNQQDKLEDKIDTENLQFHSTSVYWEHTHHDLMQIKLGSKDPSLAANLVTEIDPDASIRQQRTLSVLDQQDEEQLLHYVFLFLRAGKFEEAKRLCIQQGHSWRAATMDGWHLWHDPNFSSESEDIEPAEGNPYRDLWKINCWEMANEKSCSLNEKAIYAVLSGNLNQILPVCSKWEDCLWAHFKVLIDIQVEQELRLHPRAERTPEELPEGYWKQANGNQLSPEEIFNQLESHASVDIRRQCFETFHVFQKYLILGDVDGLLSSFKEYLGSSNVHLIRFMAHLVLFFRTIGAHTEEDICIEVLIRYIEVLIETKQFDLVALYTTQLPPNTQVKIYAKFLQESEVKDDKDKYLQLAEEAGLDIGQITKTVVENIREKEDESVYDLENASSLSNIEHQKIAAVEWLTYDISQRAEAVKQANAITRSFLAAKKLEAAQQVFAKIPGDSIDEIHKHWQHSAGEAPLPASEENAVKEYICLRAYLDAHESFNAWFEHFHHQAPAAPSASETKSFKEKIAFEQENKVYQDDFDRWQKTLSTHVKVTSDRIYNVLLFPGGWLVDPRDDGSNERRSHQLVLLRQLCIPFLTFLLHSVLQQSKMHKECFQLAEVVQSKQFKLYEVFQKFELQKLLKLLRGSSIALLDQGLDPLGFPKS